MTIISIMIYKQFYASWNPFEPEAFHTCCP